MSLSENLTKDQRWKMADALAAERLPEINARLEDVNPSSTIYGRYIKRLIDIAVSLIAVVVTSPICLILAICVRIDVGSPVLFKQERVGRNNRIFRLCKFRNMRNDRDERGELLPASERVTKFGKFIRKTSLDELLNFWSILKGDMSLIGPRPLVPEYIGRYNKRHAMRTAVRPGLECPPREPLDHPRSWQEQLDNDVWYVENLSFRTDVHMVISLVKFAFNRSSAAARAGVERGTFTGYSEDGRVITVTDVPDEYVAAFLEKYEAEKRENEG